MTHDAGDIQHSGDAHELPLTLLDRALWAVSVTGEPREEELRPAVQRHVAELRSAGASIQATVISVKQALARAERARHEEAPSLERRRLAEQVVTWSIEAYYRSD